MDRTFAICSAATRATSRSAWRFSFRSRTRLRKQIWPAREFRKSSCRLRRVRRSRPSKSMFATLRRQLSRRVSECFRRVKHESMPRCNSKANSGLYQVGRSTTFLLFQRENALTNARASELRAETDYNKALADLQRATSTTLRANNVVVDTPIGPVTFPRKDAKAQRHRLRAAEICVCAFAPFA